MQTVNTETQGSRIIATPHQKLYDLVWITQRECRRENKCCNVAQKELNGKVVDRIIELQETTGNKRRRAGRQMLRMLHGGPGTGKSHVIRLLKEELFQKELGWCSGIDFQVAAFQAVNADNVEGDTLHHALGLSPFIAQKSCQNKPRHKK